MTNSIERLLEDIVVDVRSIKTGMVEMEDRLTKRIVGLETRFDGLETRSDGLETRFDGLETRFDGLEKFMEAKFAQQDRRFDIMEEKINEANSAIQQLQVDVHAARHAAAFV